MVFWNKKKEVRHRFNDDERAAASITRTARSQLAKKKAELEMRELELDSERQRLKMEFDIEEMKQRLEELKGLDDDEGSNTEDMLMTTLLTKVLSGQAKEQAPAYYGPPAEPEVELSDDKIQEIVDGQDKKTLKLLRKLPQEQQRALILGNLPAGLKINDTTMERALFILNK